MMGYVLHFIYIPQGFPSLYSTDSKRALGGGKCGTTITFNHCDLDQTSLITWNYVRGGCADGLYI